MGQRVTQKIYECSLCGKIPEDGKYMWHMGNEIWCEQCCEKAEKTDKTNNETKLNT